MTSHSKQIGLIGLGLLGAAIGRRLVGEGFSILGFDLDPERRQELIGNRGQAAANAAEVFRECEVVILSLPDSRVVSNVIETCECDLQTGRIVLDTTTGDPDEMVEIGIRLKEGGVDYIESNSRAGVSTVTSPASTVVRSLSPLTNAAASVSTASASR